MTHRISIRLIRLFVFYKLMYIEHFYHFNLSPLSFSFLSLSLTHSLSLLPYVWRYIFLKSTDPYLYSLFKRFILITITLQTHAQCHYLTPAITFDIEVLNYFLYYNPFFIEGVILLTIMSISSFLYDQ